MPGAAQWYSLRPAVLDMFGNGLLGSHQLRSRKFETVEDQRMCNRLRSVLQLHSLFSCVNYEVIVSSRWTLWIRFSGLGFSKVYRDYNWRDGVPQNQRKQPQEDDERIRIRDQKMF